MSYQIDRCKACDAPVILARSAKTGTEAPIDAQPGRGGFIQLHGLDPANPLFTVLTVKQTATKDQTRLHTSHLKTCKYAKRTRSRVS